MLIASFHDTDLSDAWLEGDATARLRSASGTTPDGGAAAGGRPRRGRRRRQAGVVHEDGVALVPEDVPHETRNSGDGTLRLVALYGTDVTTTYAAPVQPDGERERRPLG